MKASTPYCRVYWSIVDDPKFAEVYDDDHHLSCWMRLLIVADQAWPASAFIPIDTRLPSLDKLVSVGLVERLAGSRFRIHGLDAERSDRSDRARATVSARWDRVKNGRNTDVYQPRPETDTSRAEQSRDRAEPSTPAPAREGLPHVNSTVAGIWETATGHTMLASTAYAQERLDDMCRRHPPSEVGAAILRARGAFNHIPEDRALIVAMLKLLDPISREAPQPARRKAGVTDPTVLRSRHNTGAHIDAADPACPECAA